MVLTSKHHEGFCNWDTKLTNYNAAQFGPKRDIIREYAEAARAEGLRFGFYYSLMDWHHPDGARCATDPAARRRFVDYTHGLIRELMTNYGKIDVLWYDVSWPLDAKGWESEKMNKMGVALQPDIFVNNRNRLAGDFSTPEQTIKAETGGRAIVEYVHGKPVEADFFRKAIDNVRDVVEGVLEGVARWHIAAAEPGQIRRHDMERAGEQGNEVAEHMAGTRKAVQKKQLRRAGRAGLAIEHFQAIDVGRAISDGSHETCPYFVTILIVV